MNIENLTILREWFLAGAPHYYLNMNLPYGNPADPEVVEYVDKPIPNSCGSAGCIAGAAYHLLEERPDKHIPLEDQWDVIRPKAMELLDLPEKGDPFFGHSLFNSDICPDDVTPEMAAEAIQNVIDGKDPWTTA